MHDTYDPNPGTREERLFCIATDQDGFFTTEQAHSCGYSDRLLSYHTRTGRFERSRRGVYRLHRFPTGMDASIESAVLAIGKDLAVVSHESALALHDLADVIPHTVHLTVPRTHRYLRSDRDIQLHTANLKPTDIMRFPDKFFRVTTVARSIVDAARDLVGLEQIEMATQQALQRQVASPQELVSAALNTDQYVRSIIENMIASYENRSK